MTIGKKNFIGKRKIHDSQPAPIASDGICTLQSPKAAARVGSIVCPLTMPSHASYWQQLEKGTNGAVR